MKEDQLNKKWEEFNKRVSIFNSVPFVDFVLAAGSMALGTAKENSDFDVIVGVKQGRIFTVRLFSIIFLGLNGWRRRNHNIQTKEEAKDKICLNHFVTPRKYRLSPPYNSYWQRLYEGLVPMLGDKNAVKLFFKKNDWMQPMRRYKRDHRLKPIKSTLIRIFLEIVLSGKMGDWVESFLKELQIKKIESAIHFNEGYKPRLIFSEEELEFHPDTRRIEIITISERAR